MEVPVILRFSGNIRELENIIEHAFIFCKDNVISLKHLPDSIKNKVSVESDKSTLQYRSFAELEECI